MGLASLGASDTILDKIASVKFPYVIFCIMSFISPIVAHSGIQLGPSTRRFPVDEKKIAFAMGHFRTLAAD